MINPDEIILSSVPPFLKPRPNSTYTPVGNISKLPKDIVFPLPCVDFMVRMENLPTEKGLYLLLDDDSNTELYIGTSDTDIRTNLEIITHRFDEVQIPKHMNVCYCVVEAATALLAEYKSSLKSLLNPLYNDVFDSQRQSPDEVDHKNLLQFELSDRTQQTIKNFAQINRRSESDEIEHLLLESFACKNLIMKHPELFQDYKKEILNLLFEV